MVNYYFIYIYIKLLDASFGRMGVTFARGDFFTRRITCARRHFCTKHAL